MIHINQFHNTLQQLHNTQEKCIILFTGQKDQQGNNWCPDCKLVEPYYQEIIDEAKQHNLRMLVVVAGDRPTWKDPKNILRTHKAIRISSIPTLAFFDGSKIIRKLVEAEILKKQNRKLLFEQ